MVASICFAIWSSRFYKAVIFSVIHLKIPCSIAQPDGERTGRVPPWLQNIDVPIFIDIHRPSVSTALFGPCQVKQLVELEVSTSIIEEDAPSQGRIWKQVEVPVFVEVATGKVTRWPAETKDIDLLSL